MKKLLFLIALISQSLWAQEIFSTVTVNHSQIEGSNKKVFKTLEKELEKFINTSAWTDKTYKIEERIQASFVITVVEQNSDKFNATIQVFARRPVYKSAYYSPLLSLNDKSFDFQYVEYQPILFTEQSFSSNLSNVMAYYAYIILGYDADSFKFNAGNEYFEIAQNIVDNAQGQSYKGWSRTDGSRSRYALVNKLMSKDLAVFRNQFYQYHRFGLDRMNESPSVAKGILAKSLISMGNISTGVINSYPTQLFFNTKKDEIKLSLTEGPIVNFNVVKLKTVLNKFSPNNADIWRKIKN